MNIQIARLDWMLSLLFRKSIPLRWYVKVDFMQALIQHLPRITPKISTPFRCHLIAEDIALIKQRSTAAIVIQFVNQALAMRAYKLTRRKEHLAQRQRFILMRMAAFFIGTSIDAFDASEQHVHTRRKKYASLAIPSQRSYCQQHADCLQRLLFLCLGENIRCQFFQRYGIAAAFLEKTCERPIKNQMIVHPARSFPHRGKFPISSHHTLPKPVQFNQASFPIFFQ